MREDGSFEEIVVNHQAYSGKALMDYVDRKAQNAYFMPEGSAESEDARDFMWYLWCGAKSPVYGKGKMTTFEHYFIEDPSAHKEPKKGSHIINGHVPVKIKEGESPVKAGGKLFLIDGGLSKAYQTKTGIAGYTLIYNSNHLALAEHKPFDPKKESTPKVSVVENMKNRVMVADTDKGAELAERIADLKELVAAYRDGVIKEKVE